MHKIFNFPTTLKAPYTICLTINPLLPIHSYEFRNALGKKMKKKLKQTKRGYRTQYKL